MEKRTIEEELEKRAYLLLQTTGISMEPLLHNRRSSAVIKKAPPLLEKYDVVLFKRPATGEYVLHRVWKVRDQDYLICGDNGIYMEPVKPENILGIMTGFYPDEGSGYVDCGDGEYGRYLRTLKLRYTLRWLKTLAGRIRAGLMRIGGQ